MQLEEDNAAIQTSKECILQLCETHNFSAIMHFMAVRCKWIFKWVITVFRHTMVSFLLLEENSDGHSAWTWFLSANSTFRSHSTHVTFYKRPHRCTYRPQNKTAINSARVHWLSQLFQQKKRSGSFLLQLLQLRTHTCRNFLSQKKRGWVTARNWYRSKFPRTMQVSSFLMLMLRFT